MFSSPAGSGALAAESDHLGGDVGSQHGTLGPGPSGRAQRRFPVAGGHVQDSAAGLDAGQFDQALADSTRRPVDQLRPFAPAGRSAVPLMPLAVSKLDGINCLRLHGHLPVGHAILHLRSPARGTRARRNPAARARLSCSSASMLGSPLIGRWRSHGLGERRTAAPRSPAGFGPLYGAGSPVRFPLDACRRA